MARAFSNPLQAARHLVMSSDAWMFFVEVPNAAGTGYFRVVRASKHVSADGKTWQAASLGIEVPPEGVDGSLPTVSITIPNVSRIPLALVETADELIGKVATVWLQHASALTTFDAAAKWNLYILSATATSKSLTLTLGHPPHGVQAPGPVYTRENTPDLLPTGVR